MSLVIHKEFSWVLITAAITAFQVILEGIPIGMLRNKLFTKAFVSEHFPELKGQFPKGGYPDTGNGRFSDKLSFEQWKQFNDYQRVHQNFVEGVATSITLQLICGLFFPRLAAILGFIYIIGRFIYGVGYRSKGANGRFIGVLFFDVALLLLLGGSLFGAFTNGGGVNGFLNLLFA
eukprot:TRINITY_DN6130_c0_g1_i1.p1 TRINITY_DN6130_c0_g1~~TRINITY_DN6130_c0_g1_i1.p1  ORF type:complete len:176 (+),score=93.84 TRINITY_DN6130_c0_g1_i1:65-592(+)